MDEMPLDHERVYRAWLQAIEAGADSAELVRLYTPDLVAIELPNLLFPDGAQRDLATLMQAFERGKQAVSGQRFEVSNVIAQGEFLAVELVWSATLRVRFGDRPVGSTLRASIASIVRFREGRIAEIRSYDCYERAGA